MIWSNEHLIRIKKEWGKSSIGIYNSQEFSKTKEDFKKSPILKFPKCIKPIQYNKIKN